jgi:hypothetical protein
MIQFTLMNTLCSACLRPDARRVIATCSPRLPALWQPGRRPLSEAWGLSFTLALSALISLVLAGVVFLLVPRLRRLD